MWECESALRAGAAARALRLEHLRQRVIDAQGGAVGGAGLLDAAAVGGAAANAPRITPDHRFGHMPECDTVAHRPQCSADGGANGGEHGGAEGSAEVARDGAVVLFCCAEAGTAYIHCRGTALDDAMWKRIPLHAAATAEADGTPRAAAAAAAAPSPRGAARRRNALHWTMTCASWTADGRCVVSAQAGRVPGAKRENAQRQPLPPAVVSIALWRASDGALLRVLHRPAGSGAIHVLVPHPTQAHVVLSGDEGGGVALTDLSRGATLAHFANR